ncbi:homogentisate 1,2-dioxygenase family protein [Mycolicibacterium hassiacum DSM 44199]|jgi:homogentisate 1,2-dioxygenase|uniref:Homogentisate 1,2-dioxygenase family protein n=1 Tax=Mycolicibacterium hassiacum (strain DSM 44199 / CIP 105218 / JCM 12690 / 3849) TaxID=1122247 RepID=K5BH18_MYCHD|nr:homogentisate 1,2-dioxygenase [Mycolicibacterium hassiacum]EKF24506.1 homogentisate 1,2-dioxygenase family protein [Mycolicibacterium hassiacum DSM 44199]MBX5485072.1 homogentisate 1,2-dioxygenase [Mycolicibacterium hassiacum]MDA4084371.1 homogentisate 1,2-dioxygenase [Mycolicibacterium hassiacum DSM 44199]VCT88948.1 Homogentisate 1,2-dioxygenase [Mycolicibacterium hassiacum DSM 44199]
MESFVHLRKGRTPQRMHADLDGLKDDELGRGGFTGRTATLYRSNDPTAFRAVGPLRPVDVLTSELKPADATDAAGDPLLLFSNPDCRILLSRRSQEMPYYVRYVDGDLLCFVHTGSGRLETEFGALSYRVGDWIYLPKACTWRQLPDAETTLLMVQATDEFRVPPPGYLGRHFPFDPSQATIPDPAPLESDGRDEYEVRLVHEGGPTTLYYRHHPLDVEGWQGDNFPFTFNIDQYNVITSARVHLPPTVHLFMQATGVYVMNFLPRPAESVPGTERLPWYHRNVDYDEIAFFHGGSLFGIAMPPGLLSHAPQGVHHGAPEKARERARRKWDDYDSVDWQVIAVDTRRRLVPSAEVLANDLGQH